MPKKDRWESHIVRHGQLFRLGLFPTAEEAARAFDEAAIQFFPEEMHPLYLNFPPHAGALPYARIQRW